MKKLITLLTVIAVLAVCCSCGGNAAVKERKRATAGQNTSTSSGTASTEQQTDTGLQTALLSTHAKSDKEGLVYDPAVFIKLAQDSRTTVKIACVGDSITYGTLSTNPDKYAYPVQFSEMLKTRFGNKFKVTNYGKSGAYVADFDRSDATTLRYINTEQYKQLKKDKPDIVIVQLGTNDVTYFTEKNSITEFKSAYKDLITKIKAFSSKPVVYVCTPLVRIGSLFAYEAMDDLRNAVTAVADECGVYMVDTYNITKQYYQTNLYMTDGLHPNDDGYRHLAETVYNGVVNGYTAFVKNSTLATPDYVVYVDSGKGNDKNVGASADKPVLSLARAVDLCKGGGTIVVSGAVTPALTGSGITRVFIAPENTGKITVTSIDPYNGTDYRNTNNARIFMAGSMYLNGEYEFKSLTFDTVSAGVKMVCNYNNITFGSGISNVATSGGYYVLIIGHDSVSICQTEYELSCVKNCTVTLKSGTFSYLRGGNYRTSAAFPYGTVKRGVTLTINVEGCTFANEDSASNVTSDESRHCSVIGQNGTESGSSVIMNVSSGSFKGSLSAVPRLNPYYSGKAPDVSGKITINISGGSFIGTCLDYMQTYDGFVSPKVSGSFALNISEGAFVSTTKKSISGNGCADSALTLTNSCAYLKDWASITGFKTINR